MPPALGGIIPPIVTPFTETGEIDEPAFRQEIRYHLDAGVHGISVAGSTGEGNALTPEEHTTVYQIAVEETADGIPVLAGIITTSTQEAAEKAERARRAGADYVMATPPHYMTPSDAGLIDFFRTIGAVGELPILIYDVIDHVDITAELAAEIVREVPELYGIKQSGGDFHGLSHMLARVGEDLCILSALDDILYPSFELGAKGAISGINAICPRVSVELWDAVQRGDGARARELHFAIQPLARSAVLEAQVNFPGSVKAAIALLGREPGEARSPINVPEGEQRRPLEDAIAHMRAASVVEAPAEQ